MASSTSKAGPTHVQELNNWLQQAGRSTTLQWDEKCEGPLHAPEWTVTVYVENRAMGTAKAPKKNLARDGAAKIALENLEAEYRAAGGVSI